MADVEKCKINATVENGQNMKCELKGSVNMKLQGGQTVKLTKVLYLPQAVKNLLGVSRRFSKFNKIRAT